MAPRNIKNVAVIGLGKMGNPISRHLLNGGFVVSGFDVDAKACKSAACKGIAVATSPGQAVTEADLVIVLVAQEEEVEKVLFAPDGVVARAKPETIVGIATTISPESMIRFGARLREHELAPLDMPICRGERPAEAGKLLITGGGEKAVFDACRKAFSTFASSVYRLGDVGSGQVGKMVNNLILWTCVSANHEGFKLAGKYGVDDVVMREMLLDSSAANWALETQAQRYAMPSAERDMMIALTEADRLRVSLPLSGIVKEVIKGIKIEREEHFPFEEKKS
ncbi:MULTISPECIES: NAD(P)-dependent oxidoreductase [unclassified Beijerinckia]|uniref:NAD(P)-dependent oxidoreductase n=1 Tax=unclassified Beijerinckia TaxID=2638183 RepID=UPI0008998F3A|nr:MULTISPECIES: NAD(P)-dependent oxidoreductase [unclassified Beijerinckia]MDH7796767.1 3-hydroxyisobutyrate dehydrogenase-like beta-hydroxyacid dehydrogenase [Beijerinckia sp. GAS462]SEC58998.1 3-hydroxyisobutyrate dehydrogenase/2-hydroxy-3-oxopropionate reductase [Beijerinckia sp. 28-YEA-48]